MAVVGTGSTITRFLRGLRRALLARGLNPDESLGESPIADYISYEEAAELWRRAEAQAGDPAIGLEAARYHQSGDFGAVEFAAMSSATLRAAFERVARYHRIFNDGAKVVVEGDEVHYRWPVPPRDLCPAHLDFVLGTWTKLARAQVTANPMLREVVLPVARPTAPRHEAFFGCPTTYGGRHAVLRFLPGVLDASKIDADERLAHVLDSHAQSALDDVAQAGPTARRVRDVLERILADGDPKLEHVAAHLGIAARTLRARLHREGNSFSSILDALRRSLAMQWLRTNAYTLEQIAFLLGYSEPSAFHRAHRRWTGTSPRGTTG